MLLIMKFFDLSCLLKLSVLLTMVLIYMSSNELILWSGHFRYFCVRGKLLQSLIATVENLYRVYSGKKYVTT